MGGDRLGRCRDGGGAVCAPRDTRFRGLARLPMQWSVTGRVTWSAPRRWALASMPLLAAVLLGCVAILSLTVAPRPGQEGLVLPIALAMGATLVAEQHVHVRLIGRMLRVGYDGSGAG